MTSLSKQTPSSWWTTLFLNSRLPKFQFMVHDRWANALFVHWRIPSHLEDILKDCTSPFLLDRFDGSVWIGLVLLTEQNVGPSIGRTKWTCVTHHGVNVRTYVKGIDRQDDDKDNDDELIGATVQQYGNNNINASEKNYNIHPRGIHFSSLECDDESTSFGANLFGMPYQVARMVRNYNFISDNNNNEEEENQNNKVKIDTGTPTTNTTTSDRTTRSADELACCSNIIRSGDAYSYDDPKTRYFRVRSERLRSSRPCFFRMLNSNLPWSSRIRLHSTNLSYKNNNDNILLRNGDEKIKSDRLSPTCSSSPSTTIEGTEQSQPQPQQFTIDCSWSISESSREDNDHSKTNDENENEEEDDFNSNNQFSKWAVERYFVYTQKYGLSWRGEVEHEPWPVVTRNSSSCNNNKEKENVILEYLKISNIDMYEPKSMQPIIAYMANNSPDNVLFSPGVGPVRFNMLHPIS